MLNPSYERLCSTHPMSDDGEPVDDDPARRKARAVRDLFDQLGRRAEADSKGMQAAFDVDVHQAPGPVESPTLLDATPHPEPRCTTTCRGLSSGNLRRKVLSNAINPP